jgi:hypothetical protein
MVIGSLLVSSTKASCFFGAFGRFYRGVELGGYFKEWTYGGEPYWAACWVGGFWRGGVVWGGLSRPKIANFRMWLKVTKF